MTTIAVKPHPDLDPAAWPLIVHPVSGGLLDAAKKVPDDGRPWLNDGFTARMLTDSAILRADDPVFAKPTVTGFEAATPSAGDDAKSDAPSSATKQAAASSPANPVPPTTKTTAPAADATAAH